MSENSDAWQKVFDRLDLPARLRERGVCFLTADELKLHGSREPRLMAKIDTLQERPAIFGEHQVNLFPIKNGQYALFKDPENSTYFKLGSLWEGVSARSYHAPGLGGRFDTLAAGRAFSESQAIDFAFIASLLRTFFGDPAAQLTLRGRLFSDRFSFRPPGQASPIEVNKVQIEVDAGYEGDSIFLIEAKIGKRDDFNIRQLWYPFLNWSAKSRKRIVPILLNYTNGQYFLSEFAFSDRFGDLSVVRSECHVINDSPFAALDWEGLWTQVPAEPEAAPFPQADDLDKVIDVVKLTAGGPAEKAQIADYFEFDERQGDYYANAAKYLGLIERSAEGFQPTARGVAFNQLATRAERTLAVAEQLLRRPSFRRAIGLLRERNFLLASLGGQELAGIIAQETGLNLTTAHRRAMTVRCWLTWLVKNSQAAA